MNKQTNNTGFEFLKKHQRMQISEKYSFYLLVDDKM